MKKLVTLTLFLVILGITSFTTQKNRTQKSNVRYAFITDTERDKAYDEDTNNGYVNITTNIVSVDCNIGENAIESQYIDHYEAEERTENRDRAFIGSSGITSAWIYNSYDAAMESRREWLANKGGERKRRIENFYITCD